MKQVPFFKLRYDSEIVPLMQKKFGYKNPMEMPRITKIVLNMGVGQATVNKKFIEEAANDLSLIAGQKSIITHARKANASFKIREGLAIGTKVTLRREKMYEFMDRLINIALPRVRDFRGISGKSFDGRGNYAMGMREHIVFPEISFDKVEQPRGLDIIVCTSAKTDDEARELLRAFGFPFKDK